MSKNSLRLEVNQLNLDDKTVYEITKCYVDDVFSVSNKIKKMYGKKIEASIDRNYKSDKDGLHFQATFKNTSNGKTVVSTFTYLPDEKNDTILAYDDINSKVKSVSSLLKLKKPIKSAIGDDFGEDMDTEEEDMNDTLDDMADTLDDMSDQLDDYIEDDPSITTDNNIENHYIVECDKCKGIFISSIVESDATIEKVTGRCPLCGKDSDQYLKWIIRSIDYDSTSEADFQSNRV